MADLKGINRKEIAAGLCELGIQPGDWLMVHSSLKSFGRVEGGPETVIKALQDTVTAEGLLLFPSFNHDTIFLKDGEPDPESFYDPHKSPTTNGIIPQVFWQMDNVYRSLNPSHPCAAWGQEAEAVLANHHRVLTMGADSPLGLLEKHGGSILLLGTGYAPNTLKHIIEQTNNAPCLGSRTEEHLVKLPDGRLVHGRTWGWRERNCPICEPPEPVTSLMRKNGFDKRHMIGKCEAIVFKASDCRGIMEPLLKNGWKNFPPCSKCPIRPRRSPWTVASDWDSANNCLQKDSEAHTY